MTKPVTELWAAYLWTCEACGRDNFCRAVTVEMTPEDAQAMIAEHGGDPEDWRTGQWVTRPDEVTCEHCAAQYETTDPEAPPQE